MLAGANLFKVPRPQVNSGSPVIVPVDRLALPARQFQQIFGQWTGRSPDLDFKLEIPDLNIGTEIGCLCLLNSYSMREIKST